MLGTRPSHLGARLRQGSLTAGSPGMTSSSGPSPGHGPGVRLSLPGLAFLICKVDHCCLHRRMNCWVRQPETLQAPNRGSFTCFVCGLGKLDGAFGGWGPYSPSSLRALVTAAHCQALGTWGFRESFPLAAQMVKNLCSIPGSGRPPGEGNGNSLRYSCLENPMDRRA